MQNQLSILIVDEFESSLMEALRQDGISFDYAPYMNRAEILKHIGEYNGLIIRSKTKVDKELIDNGKQLVFIARGGSGMDNINVEYAQNKHITCINAPEGNRNAVAEHSLAMLLNLFTNLTKSHNEVCKGQWAREANRGIELAGKTVGIIGFGNVGSCFASKLAALGCQVLAYDKYKNGFGTQQIKEVDLATLKQRSEVISLHVPLTDETKYLVDTDFVESVTRPFFLLNTSRGKVVQLSAVTEGLQNGSILGAGLDVLENEDFNTHTNQEKAVLTALCNDERVVLSPHVAGWTHESYKRIAEVLADKTKTMLRNNEFFASEILINLKN